MRHSLPPAADSAATAYTEGARRAVAEAADPGRANPDPARPDRLPRDPAEPALERCDREAAAAAAEQRREEALVAWLRAHAPVLIGYSGGVDSAYLATVAAAALGPERVLAVVGRSASYPMAQWETARAVATRAAIPLLEVDTHELEDPAYAANPSDRCYHCKRELWSRLAPLAVSRGMTLLDGTNADDLGDWRPGMRAGREHAVRSPLAELGFTKAAIRALSRRRGLPTWSQPSAPCLSSRLPYGTPVTSERLAQVERAEAALRALGIAGELRVRHHGPLARVELGAAELDRWLGGPAAGALRRAVLDAGFSRVAVDLRPFRSGSLNVLGGVSA